MPKQPTLTDRQRKFAESLVYEAGRKSPAECAFEAGYRTRPRQAASELKNPKIYPLVAKYIGELRNEAMEKYGINFQKHLMELSKIRDEARKKGAFSAAGNMEIARGKVGGLYVEKRVNVNANMDIESLSPEELQAKLDSMYDEDIKDVTPKSEPEESELKQDPESD